MRALSDTQREALESVHFGGTSAAAMLREPTRAALVARGLLAGFHDGNIPRFTITVKGSELVESWLKARSDVQRAIEAVRHG